MRYLQRDAAGLVIGHYANPQTTRDGVLYTEPDPVADDHPDILAWDEKNRLAAESGPRVGDLLTRLSALEGKVAAVETEQRKPRV